MVVAPQFSTVMDDNDDDEGTDVAVLKQLFVIAQITMRIKSFIHFIKNVTLCLWIHPRVSGDTKQTDRPTDRQKDPLIDDDASENKKSSMKATF